ncbi:hypothetical protein GB937_009829 [Aspergillus fischeri]|nr:hypothetical protein GB937_009829 [Aspergillus fischeri]
MDYLPIRHALWAVLEGLASISYSREDPVWLRLWDGSITLSASILKESGKAVESPEKRAQFENLFYPEVSHASSTALGTRYYAAEFCKA